ncbi:MAG TPA: histidine phosphotransferase family protein [Roseiarcus sp.]|jgi:histidine phosphotransferase ChpT|nr:histidine phosphotransferase family protein [Roseiarcus sp.]
MTIFALDGLDLASLACSRVCHDVISPVGAIINGLEVLEEEKDAEMRQVALDLIKKSAATASARLQFCRLAFGAAGSSGATIDTSDAEKVTRGLIADDRTKLVWSVDRQLAPKNKVKLILNLCVLAFSAIPRGGVVTVAVKGGGDFMEAEVEAKGPNARLAKGAAALIAGEPENGAVDAHSIQPFFAGVVARSCGMGVAVGSEGDRVILRATPVAATLEAQRG